MQRLEAMRKVYSNKQVFPIYSPASENLQVLSIKLTKID